MIDNELTLDIITSQLPPCFISILTELGAYDSYCKYLIKENTVKEFIGLLRRSSSYVELLMRSFIYCETEEGLLFWFNIEKEIEKKSVGLVNYLKL